MRLISAGPELIASPFILIMAICLALSGCARQKTERADDSSLSRNVENQRSIERPRPRLTGKPNTFAVATTSSSFSFKLPHLIYPIGDWRDSTSGQPYAVEIGDVTRDGKKDVVLVTLGSRVPPLQIDHKVIVFKQNAHGGLDAPSLYPYTDGLYENANNGIYASVALADMNEDGANDIVVAYLKGVTVLLSTDSGFQSNKFLLPPQFRNISPIFDVHYARQMVALDLNRDRHKDLVVFHGGAASAFYGNGYGSFSSIEEFPLPIFDHVDAKTEDFDQDGGVDVVLLSGYRDTSRIRILLNPGSGKSWSEKVLPIPSVERYGGIALGDWNGDSRIDAAVSISKNITNDGIGLNAGVLIAEQNASGELLSPRFMPTWQVPEAMVSMDLNGDRIKDLLIDHPGWDIGYMLNSRQGLQLEVVVNHGEVGSSGSGNQVITSGDITGDGCSDIVRAERAVALMVYHGQHCEPPRQILSRPLPAEL